MKTSVCKHCHQSFDVTNEPRGWMANHSRWCSENPRSSGYRNNMTKQIAAMNAKKEETGVTNQYTKAVAEGREKPISPMKGRPNLYWLGRKHTDETKAKMSVSALESSHRRLNGRSRIHYKGVLMDSAWELMLAKRLDALGVRWERPEPLRWVDKSEIVHHYFPDFYLPDYDLYLDPKNAYAYADHEDKITCLNEQYSNVVFLTSEEQCLRFNPLEYTLCN
jgi:hypothetical protein